MARKKATETPAVRTAVTHEIDLGATDTILGARLVYGRGPRPEPKLFDRQDCVRRLGKVVTGARYGVWRSDWAKAQIEPVLTRPEARFWLEAGDLVCKEKPLPEIEAALAEIDFAAPLSRSEIISRAVTFPDHRFTPAIPLVNLLPPEEAVEVLLTEELVVQGNWQPVFSLSEAFLDHVVPYLGEEQIEPLRSPVRTYLQTNPTSQKLVPLCLAAGLGMHAELQAHIARFPDNFYANCPSYRTHGPHYVLFNLGDARLIEHHGRRLKLSLHKPEQVRAWLFHTRWQALDFVRDNVLACIRKADAEQLVKTLALVRAPEVAPYLLEIKLHGRAPSPARKWLDAEVGNAAAGLIPLTTGRGKLADAALEYLREAQKRGFADVIAEQLQSTPSEAADKVRQEVLDYVEKVYEPLNNATTPDWLKEALAASTGKPAKVPDWARPTNLPPLLVGERRLSDEQTQAVLGALRSSTFARPHPLVTALCQHLERGNLDGFGWRLFELWQGEGTPSKDKWAFLSLGFLGGDATALKLTPLLRAWPGEGKHSLAASGLECLRAIGSDTALTQLNSIAQKVKFKGLQIRAREFMEAIAVERGISRTELEDRIVPDLDLDERGSRVFDFGPRHFRFVLGTDLKPLVRDEAGKAKPDPPKPGAKDDAEKAAAAVAAWKLLKKQIREAVKVQAVRLEQAMVTGRRWAVSDFERLLVRHPLQINLVSRLLWAGYDGDGKRLRTFRVTEEREYADVEDSACRLDAVATVGIVHPLHLGEEERSRWGEVFGDYEIIAPFPQLGRPIHHLQPDEAKAKEITRLAGCRVPGLSVVGQLEKTGWQRGDVLDGGVFSDYHKHFPGANVTAVIDLEPGLYAGMLAESEEQTVRHCCFLSGLAAPYWRRDRPDELVLGDVDPVVLSEVLTDLGVLASKGK
jgi:hypothetical protein